MARRTPKNQPRSKRIGIAVTAEERQALVGLAAARGVKDFSTLLRDHSLTYVLKEWARIKRVLEDAGAAA